PLAARSAKVLGRSPRFVEALGLPARLIAELPLPPDRIEHRALATQDLDVDERQRVRLLDVHGDAPRGHEVRPAVRLDRHGDPSGTTCTMERRSCRRRSPATRA